ncbi:TPR and ankyrin repeat-containing protein 1-like isoform X2 [Rhizophagus clarus]|uniref:TPR and ankyrin repeat-containing protein 1-like isoform X2 n=1 Tax=Rhizophagus clarus TaxID=94130 RepID=A0A8H3R0Z7_9GLOM|nr:TPR and ankyrin repeat-containing protein 1-like isoform X2 [Rhizophagus clarus]
MLQEMYGIKNVIKQRKLDAADIDTYDKKEKLYQSHLSLKHRILKITRSLKKDIGLVLIGSNPKVDFLTREDYSNISIKYPVFSYDWDKIYDLFEKYEIEKARNGHYDPTLQNVGNFMSCQKKALDGPHIHEVYIDECQDKVFDHDSHALMYKWERTRAKINYSNIIINPSRFELDINYRSHNGILQLASSVIDLIRHFFPNSIDHLSCEREAKRMEFDDVLLYNFFTDSPASRKREYKTVSNLAKKSESYEWNQRGKNLFEEQQYEQQTAKDFINDSDDNTIKSNFINAIIAFKECSRPGQAALCYQANMLHETGEHFEKAKKYDDAALAYKDGFLKDSHFYKIATEFISI